MGIPIIDEIIQVIVAVVTWFFSVMPAPLKIFFFLFFVIFIGGSVMGWTLGFLYTCDSAGHNVYDVAYFDRASIEKGIDLGYQQCLSNTSGSVGAFFADWFTWGITKDIVRGSSQVDCEDYVNVTSTDMFDSMLQKYGSPVDSQNGVGLTCVKVEGRTSEDSGYHVSLGFYGQDVMDKQVWLLASVLVLLMPLAFYWYMVMFK